MWGTIARLKGEEIREGDFFNFSNELTKNLEKKVTKDMPPEEQLIFDLQKADLRQKTDQMPDSLVTKFLDGSQKVSTDVAGGALEIVGKSLKASTDWVNNRAGFNEEILAELDNLRTPEGKIDLEKITDPWRIAQAISGGIGSMIPAAAAFGVTGNPLSFGVVMFTQEKVDAYETYSQELAKTKEIAIEDLTKEDLQKIDEYSDYYGVLSAALETAAPMTIGGRILGKQAAKGAVKSFLLQVPKEVLRGVVLEGSTEAMQRFSQNLIAKESGINPDQDLYDGVFEEGYAGAATGGFFGTFAGVSQANKARIEASQKQQSKMNTILDESFDQTEKQFEGIDLKTGQPKEVKVSGADPVDTRPLNKDLVQGRIDDVAQKIERNFGKEPTIVYKPTSFVTVEVSNSIAKIQKQQGEVISGGLVDGVVKDISQKIEKNFGRRARGVDQALESALKGKTFSNIEQFQKSILAVLKTLEIPANPKDVKGVKEADLFREEMEGREYITLDELKMKSQEAITRIAFDATKSKRFNPNLAFFDNEQTKKRDAINLEDVQRRQIESVVDIVPDNLVEIVGDAIAQDLDADTIASLSVPERQVLANALDAVQQVGTNNVVSSNIQQLAGTGIELPDNVVAGLDVPKRAVSREDTTVPTKPTPVSYASSNT